MTGRYVAAAMAAVAACAAQAVFVGFSGPAVIIACLALFLALTPVYPRLFFAAFIVARPAIDVFAAQRIAGPLNIAAVMTIVVAAVCGAYLLFGAQRSAWRDSPFLRRFNLFFGVVVLTGFASLLHTRDMAGSGTDLIRLVSLGVAVNYAAVYFRGERAARRFALLLLASSLLPFTAGLQQLLFGRGVLDAGFVRVYGTFLHPNVFAEYILLVFAALGYLLSSGGLGRAVRWAAWAWLGLAALLLYATFTRGVWIAWACAAALYGLVRTGWRVKLVFVLSALMVAAVAAPLAVKRFSDVAAQRSEEQSSWEWRLKQWRRTLRAVTDQPFTGHGLGMYEKTYRTMAHNDYLKTAYESGIPGLLAYLCLLLYMGVAAIVRLFRETSRERMHAYRIGACLIAAVMIMSLADNLARSTVILLAYFCFTAVMLESGREDAA